MIKLKEEIWRIHIRLPYESELIEERDNLRNLRLKAKEKSLSNLNNNPVNKMAGNQNTTKGCAVDLSNLDKSSPNLDGISDDGDNLKNLRE